MTENIYHLPVYQAIQIAWGKVKGSKSTFWRAFVGIVILFFIFMVLQSLLIKLGVIPSGQFIRMTAHIVQFILGCSLIYIGIRRAMDLPISFKMITYPLNGDLILKFACLYALKFFILLPSMALFALASYLRTTPNLFNHWFSLLIYWVALGTLVYLAVRMWLSLAVILDKKLSAWQAIKISFKATQHNVGGLIGFYILNMLIIIVSIIPFGIGLIWSMPYAFIAYGVIYKLLMDSQTNVFEE
jgi:membrane-anchored glycerophosphoryl diester phosphodiesterase (GDPDase)